MMFLRCVLFLLFTYLLLPIVLLAFLLSLQGEVKKHRGTLFVVSLAIAPLLVGKFVDVFYFLCPDARPAACMVLIVFLAAAAAILLRDNFKSAVWPAFRVSDFLSLDLFREHILSLVIAGYVCVRVFVLFATAWNQPLVGNDALEYATLARLIYNYGDNSFYIFSSADPATGFFGYFTHPLGYVSLIVWSYIMQGGCAEFGLGKFIAPWAVLMSTLLVYSGLRRRGPMYGVAGALMVLFSPYLVALAGKAHHIDPLQAMVFFLAVFCASQYLRYNTKCWMILTGLAVGLSMHTHSIGLLTLPFVLFGCLLLSKEHLWRRCKILSVILLIALSIGGGQYLENHLERGRIIGDDNPIWQLQELQVKDWFRQQCGLVSGVDRLVKGVFKCWSYLELYGIAPMFALLSAFACWRTKDVLLRLCVLNLGFFYVLVFMTYFLGIDTIIKNERYFIFVQPFFIVLAATGVGMVYEKMSCAVDGFRGRGYAASLAFVFILFVSIIAVPRVRGYVPSKLSESFPLSAYLSDWERLKSKSEPSFQMIDYIRSNTPSDSVFMVYKKGDFAFYAQRKLVYDLDPRLLSYYSITNSQDGAAFLVNMGVDYILTPPYEIPTLNGAITYILIDDSRLTRLEKDIGGWRLYKLYPRMLAGERIHPEKAHVEVASVPDNELLKGAESKIGVFVDFSVGVVRQGRMVFTYNDDAVAETSRASSIVAGPSGSDDAIFIDWKDRLMLKPTSLELNEGAFLVWAQLSNCGRKYSDLIRVNKNNDMYLYHSGADKRIHMYFNGSYQGASSLLVDDDRWHLYAFVWSEGRQVLYIDGRIALETCAGVSGEKVGDIAIGWLGNRGGEQWVGRMSGLMTFKNSLSDNEMRAVTWDVCNGTVE